MKTLESGRRLRILYRRDPELDTIRLESASDETLVRFSGYQMHWEDGARVEMSFARFCEFGTRALFGKGNRPESQLVDMYFVPVTREEPITRVPKPLKARRLFAIREGVAVTFYFYHGIKTEMVFDIAADDSRVIDWIGGKEMEEGVVQWFDFVAVRVESEERQKLAA